MSHCRIPHHRRSSLWSVFRAIVQFWRDEQDRSLDGRITGHISEEEMPHWQAFRIDGSRRNERDIWHWLLSEPSNQKRTTWIRCDAHKRPLWFGNCHQSSGRPVVVLDRVRNFYDQNGLHWGNSSLRLEKTLRRHRATGEVILLIVILITTMQIMTPKGWKTIMDILSQFCQ